VHEQDQRGIGVAGRAPVTFIGGVSTDHSGFGVGRILDVELIAGAALFVISTALRFSLSPRAG